MREIKFRVWDESSAIMRSQNEYNAVVVDCFFNSDLVLMQYTGMKDKNGKEIYEGDIVKIAYGIEKPYKEIISEVIYDDGYEVDIGRLASFHNVCEVIGNIYENPELLEKIGGDNGN